MKNKLIKLLLVASFLTGCSTKTDSSKTSSVTDSYSNTSLTEVFNTVYSFKEYSTNHDLSVSHFKASEKLLQKYTELFDIYNDYEDINNLKTINDNAGIQPVEVDQAIIDLLDEAKKFYTYSNGEFDITIGSLLKVWHTYREAGIEKNENGELGEIPSEEELKEAASHKGWDKVEIDYDNKTVYITDKDVSLDVGGIAKGYATELVAKTMQDTGMTCGILNVGRNIRLIGTKEDSSWTVGITDPDGDPDGKYPNGLVLLSLDSEDSVVTSGDYERYYKAVDGNNYPHIVDPATMYPARYYRSVSIVTKDSGAADCLSTSLFTMSIEDGKQLLKTYSEISGNECDAVWIVEDSKTQDQQGKKVGNYTVIYTEGLEDKIIWN